MTLEHYKSRCNNGYAARCGNGYAARCRGSSGLWCDNCIDDYNAPVSWLVTFTSPPRGCQGCYYYGQWWNKSGRWSKPILLPLVMRVANFGSGGGGSCIWFAEFPASATLTEWRGTSCSGSPMDTDEYTGGNLVLTIKNVAHWPEDLTEVTLSGQIGDKSWFWSRYEIDHWPIDCGEPLTFADGEPCGASWGMPIATGGAAVAVPEW